MTEERKRVSPEQLEILIDELEKDQSLINGPRTSAQGRTNYNVKWDELAEKLNSVEGGALKNVTKWQQSLRDWRNNTKKKIATKSSGQGDGTQELTSLESRLMALCNNEPSQAKTVGIDVSSVSEVDPLSAENSTSDEEAPYPNTHTTYVCDEEKEQSGDDTKFKVKRRRVQVMSEDVISQQNKLLDRLTALEASRQESENRQNQLLEGVTRALDRHAAATASLTRAAEVQAHVLTQILHILREGRQEN